MAGFLVRLEGDRVRVTTLGPGVFGRVVIFGVELIDVSFAQQDLASMVAHLLRSIEEQGE